MFPHIKLLFASALLTCSVAFALPSRPAEGHIYDENRLMNFKQADFFNHVSDLFYKKTGSPIDVILLDDIGERDAGEYASEISEKWRSDAGTEGEILIFVALKQRRKFIATSGNAIGILPKGALEKIEQEKLVPKFRSERYGDGVIAFAMELTQTVARLDIDAPPPEEESPMTIRGWIFIAVVFGLLVIFGRKSGRFGFFDNMKKLLSISEIEKSEWPGIFQKTFGGNLISAFLHGGCLMEGFDALKSPWTISFILKENSPETIAKLDSFSKKAARENICFCKFYTPAKIVGALDTHPLEFLHIANRNVPLCGIQPLAGFEPRTESLRHQCERELREIQEQLQAGYRSASGEKAKRELFEKAIEKALPLLYGVYYLETKNYPENNGAVLERYPARDCAGLLETLSGALTALDGPASEPATR